MAGDSLRPTASISARRDTLLKENGLPSANVWTLTANLKSNGDAAANKRCGRGTYIKRDNRLIYNLIEYQPLFDTAVGDAPTSVQVSRPNV